MDDSLLFQNLNQYTSIGTQEFESIKEVLSFRKIKKRKTLLHHGEVSRHLFFVQKGALRSFTVGQDGNEHIMQFAFEGHWVADLSSFITQTAGEIVIEAIEDSEVLLLPHHDLEILLDKIPTLEKFFRQLYQRAYVALQKRLNMRESTPAKERYKELIAKHPNIARRVPLLYIASYLGITAESLSRVRGTMANER
jgi:CRP-like cAMP-binding protein